MTALRQLPGFAQAAWYSDPTDHRCPHDAWLEAIEISEPSEGERKEKRKTAITVRLLGAYHDGYIILRYAGVSGFSIGSSSVGRGLGDWFEDRFPSHQVLCSGTRSLGVSGPTRSRCGLSNPKVSAMSGFPRRAIQSAQTTAGLRPTVSDLKRSAEDMRPSFSPFLRERLASGASFEDGLRSLREAGASPIDTIKAIQEVKKTDLAVAKQMFSESAAWRDASDAAQILHEELIAAIEAEQKKDADPDRQRTTRGM